MRQLTDTAAFKHLHALYGRAKDACFVLVDDFDEAAVALWSRVLQRSLAKLVVEHQASFQFHSVVIEQPSECDTEDLLFQCIEPAVIWRVLLSAVKNDLFSTCVQDASV